MNHQRTFNLFNGRDQVRGKISILILSLVMLLPVALTACAGVFPNVSEGFAKSVESEVVAPAPGEISDSTFLAANPELIVARRYVVPVVENEATSDPTFLAANPELMVARRYANTIRERTDPAFLAANPELLIVRRYAAAAAEK